MKKHLRHLMVTALLGGLLAGQSAFAGECCTKAAKAAKAGKTCAACETRDCCKQAVQKVADAGKAKPCAKCAAKKKEKSAAPTRNSPTLDSTPGSLAWPGF
jgi:hypothetical protein